MRRASGSVSTDAVITISCPALRPRPTLIATDASWSRFSAGVRVSGAVAVGVILCWFSGDSWCRRGLQILQPGCWPSCVLFLGWCLSLNRSEVLGWSRFQLHFLGDNSETSESPKIEDSRGGRCLIHHEH